MKKAYIILVHKAPEQVYRLISRLDDNNSTFFIHIDKKVRHDLFSNLNDFGNKIIYIKGEDGRWGGFGIVRGSLNGLKAIKESNIQFDRINLISGQDYPIKSNDYINDFFRNSDKSIFIKTFSALPVSHWHKGGVSRIYKYFFGLKAYQKFIAKGINFSINIFPFLKKTIPYDLTVYGGSQWWTIDMYALNYILEYLDAHPKVYKFFKYSLLADELFFQTILLNSTDQVLIDRIENDNKRYIYIPPGDSHPVVWKKDNLNELISSDALFSRKFDMTIDSQIFDLIDQRVLNVKEKA